MINTRKEVVESRGNTKEVLNLEVDKSQDHHYSCIVCLLLLNIHY